MKHISTFIALTLLIWGAVIHATTTVEENKFIIEGISCEGNKKTSCSFIKQTMRLQTGKEVKESLVENAKIRLQLLSLFKEVNFSLEKGSERGRVNLLVSVIEDSSFYTSTSLHFQNISGDRYNLDLSKKRGNYFGGTASYTVGDRNLFGLGKRLSLTYLTNIYEYQAKKYTSGELDYVLNEVAKRHRLSLKYTDPNLFGSRRFFLDSFVRGGYWDFTGTDYTEYRGGINFGYRFSSFHYLTLGTEYYKGEYKNTALEADEGLIHTLGYGYNSQDDLYFPTKGVNLDLKFRRYTYSSSFFDRRDSDNANFNWNYISPIGKNTYLSLFVENNEATDDELQNFKNRGFGFELSAQTRRNRNDKEFSDLRFYLSPSVVRYSGFFGKGYEIGAGLKFRSKSFGIGKIGVTYVGEF